MRDRTPKKKLEDKGKKLQISRGRSKRYHMGVRTVWHGGGGGGGSARVELELLLTEI
jgi:hypothetical protein